MLAEAVKREIKAPAARRATTPSRGLLERSMGWVLFTAVDGRGAQRARANAPFEPRGTRGFVALAMVPGIILLVLAGMIFWRPILAEPDMLTTIPIAEPSQTSVERRLVRGIDELRDGIWEARLPPWSEVPSKGMARVSNPEVHAALEAVLGEIAAFGDSIGDGASPGAHRDRVFLDQIAGMRKKLSAIDVKLGGVRSITAYHLGLLALWAGDAADAEPQFASVVAIARKTEPIDDAGRQRLDGIEASASYGLGLAEAGRGFWQSAISDFDAALVASCRAALDSQTNSSADSSFVLGRANLVTLDTRSIRNDRLVALLNARNAGDTKGAVTNPTCAQLQSPDRSARNGDADAEARALFVSLAVDGDPTLAANLQLRAALMGERDVVQRLSFDGADAQLQQAQSLARAIAGLEQTTDASSGSVDRSALADLQKISVLKSRLLEQLQNNSLSEPENDSTWSWSSPALFEDWKRATASLVGSELLAKADDVRHDSPGLAAALYGIVISNRTWLSQPDVIDAWWRLNTGTSLSFALSVLMLAMVITAAQLLILRRWRLTYRTTFESYHHSDRARAPEG